MEQNSLSRKDLEPCIRASGRVSEVLSKKRSLTLASIIGVATAFPVNMANSMMGADQFLIIN